MNKYKYLGSKITEDGRSTRDILSRINQVKCAFQSKKNMFISRNIDIKVRRIKGLCLERSTVWK